jgi:hypothetical protein
MMGHDFKVQMTFTSSLTELINYLMFEGDEISSTVLPLFLKASIAAKP